MKSLDWSKTSGFQYNKREEEYEVRKKLERLQRQIAQKPEENLMHTEVTRKPKCMNKVVYGHASSSVRLYLGTALL